MTVISTHKDTENLTLTFVAEFAADVERVWQVWEDPRQLERWWGPPTWPATFVRHDFVEGGESRYYMTGPEGEKARGWWKTTAVQAPNTLEFDDGFAGEDGEPSGFLGTTHCVVKLEGTGATTRMTFCFPVPDSKSYTSLYWPGGTVPSTSSQRLPCSSTVTTR